ncbi:hypothetical protein Q7P36_008356 [Cladosporium allicinum]
MNIDGSKMAEFRLSTLDQNAPRAYMHYALCFACNDRDSAVITERLRRAVKSLVSEVPMLAGTVTTDDQQKPTNVTVTPKQVEEFVAAIKHLQGHTQGYHDIYQDGFAPRHLHGIDLTALADKPGDHSPSCAIQANFINGGLALVICLHHAVADINGMSTILRLMSEGLPTRRLDNDELQSEATVVSQARSCLSQGSGAPAFLSLARDINQRREQGRQRQQQQQQIHNENRDDNIAVSKNSDPNIPSPRSAILFFRLDLLIQTTEMLNSRCILRNSTTSTTEPLSLREVLIAILWRAYVRARYSSSTTTSETHNNDLRTSISFPIDLRSSLIPPLSTYWLGNASTRALAHSPLAFLLTLTNISTLGHTANLIHIAARAQNSDLLVRSRINLLNSSAPERDWIPTPQFVVHDWTSSMPEGEEMDLGLGLGAPHAVRRIGRGVAGRNEVVLLPVNWGRGMWEVQIELEERVMRALADDGGLRAWLWGAVG